MPQINRSGKEGTEAGMNKYLARQPIFDKNQEVFAYELLYRSGQCDEYSNTDGDQATTEVITSSLLLIGLDTLTRGKKAFINFTRNLLENGVADLLPNELVVIEILENIEPDEKILKACKLLKEKGYLLALDDFSYDHKFKPLIDLADIIKVDFKATGPEERKAIIKRIGKNKKYLAEKVETREEFEFALGIGYSYFQGYFFSKPVIVEGKDISGNKLFYIQLLKGLYSQEIDFQQMENIFKKDLALSYKLLKYINSAAFSFRTEIHSINQALVMLGQKGISKWVSLVALKGIGEDKPNELLVTSVCRAMFCELIAPKVGLANRCSDLFLMGMFSLIDAFLDQPLSVVLSKLPISMDIMDALLGEQCLFNDVYNLALFYEQGDWEKLQVITVKLGLDEAEATRLYIESLAMANQMI
ncbi:MAG: EAL and HDOD domain-containing protein [Bacillota bacterium]